MNLATASHDRWVVRASSRRPYARAGAYRSAAHNAIHDEAVPSNMAMYIAPRYRKKRIKVYISFLAPC